MYRKNGLIRLQAKTAIKEALNHAGTAVSLRLLLPTTITGATSVFRQSCRRLTPCTRVTIFWGILLNITLFHLNS
jgi:hypothetical protein